MKLLVDMNLSPRWVGVRKDAGWEAVHWSTIGIVLTHDLDFSAILAATHGEKPSVVQVRTEDVSPSVVGSQVIVALRHVRSELETGALVTVDPHRTRVRLLPLPPKH